MNQHVTQSPCQTTNGLRLFLVCVPDSAHRTGDASGVLQCSATLSDEMVDWMRCGTPDEFSNRRIDCIVRSLLVSMRDEGWDPHAAQSLVQPLRFAVVVDASYVSVVTTVHRQGPDLLHIAMDNCSEN